MKFLVTGFPRTRTAWLSALLSAHLGKVVPHERLPDEPIGDKRCDPGAAMSYWTQAANHFACAPVVFLRRDPHEVRRSLERWAGVKLDDRAWDRSMYLFRKEGPYLADVSPSIRLRAGTDDSRVGRWHALLGEV